MLSLLGDNITAYPSSPETAKLETFPNPNPARPYVIHIVSPEFTSLCPITKQPDFATIEITYIPRKRCIESKALKLYLFSFRNTGMFFEAVTNKILDDLVKAVAPQWMEVRGIFNRRGGIDFTVTAAHGKK
ncbi:MAG: NADPH-dependent 7-cyano-7-deazaguanine reductase QueF [Spirochaetes bacterium]|nr:NADPH-dependent 7-cyano-7-deazaguanine reductase QueF [Spirochaetota bacterium]